MAGKRASHLTRALGFAGARHPTHIRRGVKRAAAGLRAVADFVAREQHLLQLLRVLLDLAGQEDARLRDQLPDRRRVSGTTCPLACAARHSLSPGGRGREPGPGVVWGCSPRGCVRGIGGGRRWRARAARTRTKRSCFLNDCLAKKRCKKTCAVAIASRGLRHDRRRPTVATTHRKGRGKGRRAGNGSDADEDRRGLPGRDGPDPPPLPLSPLDEREALDPRLSRPRACSSQRARADAGGRGEGAAARLTA